MCGGWGNKAKVCSSNQRFSPEEESDNNSQFMDSRTLQNSKCKSFPLKLSRGASVLGSCDF